MYPDGSPLVPLDSLVKARLETQSGGWIERVPAWAKLARQDTSTNLRNGVPLAWPEDLRIHEAHVGMGSKDFHPHGIGKGYAGGFHEYLGPDADIESHTYLMLANDIIHSILPAAITVGEDASGMPTLRRLVAEGGFGFDYRLAMAIPDVFTPPKESNDEERDMGHGCHTLTNRHGKENDRVPRPGHRR